MAEIVTDYLEERNALLHVTSEDGSCKGWRVDSLAEKFSSKVEEKLLLCSYCNGLLRDACLFEEELRCGVCIPEGVSWQPLKMNRNIVNEKMIYCPLKLRGCEWNDTVSAAVHHLEDCLYLPERCPLGCVSLEGERKGKVIRFERRHIAEHVSDSCPMRIVVCEFCEREVKAGEMNPHLDVCEWFTLPCPNHCSREGEEGVRELKRKDIPVHLDSRCPLQKIKCAYWDQGCREEMERKLADIHEREFIHIHFKLATKRLQSMLDVATEKIAVQELELAEVRRELADRDKRIQSISEIVFSPAQITTGRLEWKVEGVKRKIQNKDTTYSDPFYVGLYKCQCGIEWCFLEAGIVELFLCIMQGYFDEKLHWPIRYKFTSILVNRNHSKDNLVTSHEVSKEFLEMFPECFERPTEYRNLAFGSFSFISNTEILEEKYCKQDSITLYVSVEIFPHDI